MLRHAIKLIYTCPACPAWEKERLVLWVVAIMFTQLCSMASFELVLEAKFEVLFGGTCRKSCDCELPVGWRTGTQAAFSETMSGSSFCLNTTRKLARLFLMSGSNLQIQWS